MKKLLLILISTLSLTACVDKDFDLGDVNTKELTFGNEFITPIGNIELKLKDILDFGDKRGRANSNTIMLPENFYDSFEMNGGFDKGIVDALTESGEITIEADIVHPINSVKIALNISFFNNEEESPVIVNEVLSAAGNKTSISINITKDILSKIASAQRLFIQFKVIEGGNQEMSLNPNDIITIKLRLKRTGGLKF